MIEETTNFKMVIPVVYGDQTTDWYIGDAYCKKCGKPFCYVGDVPPNGWTKGLEPYCVCGDTKLDDLTLIYPQGWICPICGAGVNPNTNVCPCRPLKPIAE